MARHDRCIVCDYSEASGSSIANTPPGSQGKVRRFGDEFLCSVCAKEILYASYIPEEDEGEVEHLVEEVK